MAQLVVTQVAPLVFSEVIDFLHHCAQRRSGLRKACAREPTFLFCWLEYLYRGVDRLGQTVDFLLTARRDEAAARRFFERAIGQHDLPEKITIDKSGANTAAVRGLIAGIELMHMIKKGPLSCSTGIVVSDADRFYRLATR